MKHGAGAIDATKVATRRRLLLAAAVAPVAVPLTGCASSEVKTFPTIASALKAIENTKTGWKSAGAFSLAQMLNHAAQSIEYSMGGFPEHKPAWFQATAGKAAFAVFDARGAMSHSLAEPIPGAPPLDDVLEPAIERAVKAWRAFEAHTGALKPHFAYGALDKPQYTRAHLMHLANHWTERVPTGANPT